MATVNMSETQLNRVRAVVELVGKHLPVKVSQADIVNMGMELLEQKYGHQVMPPIVIEKERGTK